MTKDFLLRLTEEHYGAGEFPAYGRLLAHLLGPTPVNPLPPHCHCPICRYLIFNAHADDG